jgi:hypothetical protein
VLARAVADVAAPAPAGGPGSAAWIAERDGDGSGACPACRANACACGRTTRSPPARRVYLARGFALVGEEPHRSFGHDLVAQTYEPALGP